MVTRIVKAFTAAGFGTFLAGCVTTTDYTTGDCIKGRSVASPVFGVSHAAFDQTCADRKFARAAINNPDRQIQAVGLTVERNLSKTVDTAAEQVLAGKGAPPARTQTNQCQIEAIDPKKRQFALNCL